MPERASACSPPGTDFAGLVLESKYRLIRSLGSGAMGHVWEAEHLQLCNRVAVKLLRPELVSDPAVVARFQQEALAAGRIGHPHIIDVLDAGTTPGGAPFLVLELLRGRPLSALLEEQPIPPLERTLGIQQQILLALGAAHAAGIVHRDLKPDNVFLVAGADRADFVKLVDFGIAKAKDDPKAAHLTRTGMLLGTPLYMSPEQVQGKKDVDHRADIWSAGVILYQMLAGRLPHDATDLGGLFQSILGRGAVPLRNVRPDLPAWLDATVMRALARDPADRFPSADAFREGLAWGRPSKASLPSLSAPPSLSPLPRVSATAFAPTALAPVVPALATPPSIAPPPSGHGVLAGIVVVVLALAAGTGIALWMAAAREPTVSRDGRDGRTDSAAAVAPAAAASTAAKRATQAASSPVARPDAGGVAAPTVEQFLAAYVAANCAVAARKRQAGADGVSEDDARRVVVETAARFGLRFMDFARLISEYGADPAVRARMDRWDEACPYVEDAGGG